jgi:SAM-dependent methyltransferase
MKSRSLESIDKKLFRGSSTLRDTIERLLEVRRPVTVLEIGCGAGRALMELACAFRHAPVVFHAINKESGKPLASSADLRRVAHEHGLPWDDGAPLPALYFYDATTLHFADDSLDLIYLSSVARFIERKAEFVEEVCRVLAPGGKALIQISKSGWDYPPGPARDDLLVTTHPSRFVLTYGQELVPLPRYLKRFATSGFEFDFISAPSCVMRIRKRRAGRIALGLEFDASRSVPMTRLPFGADDVREARGGFRSVYRVTREAHRAMLETPEPAGDTAATPPAGPQSGAGDRGGRQKTKAPRTVTCYRVGQRVKVKGQRSDNRIFRATKIRPNDDGLEWEELEGRIEWVDAATGTFGLLGCTVCADAARSVTGAANGSHGSHVIAGDLAKVSGAFRNGLFAPRRVLIKDPPAVVVEEIQGAIRAIDPAGACLEVAGFTVKVDARTRLVTE